MTAVEAAARRLVSCNSRTPIVDGAEGWVAVSIDHLNALRAAISAAPVNDAPASGIPDAPEKCGTCGSLDPSHRAWVKGEPKCPDSFHTPASPCALPSGVERCPHDFKRFAMDYMVACGGGGPREMTARVALYEAAERFASSRYADGLRDAALRAAPPPSPALNEDGATPSFLPRVKCKGLAGYPVHAIFLRLCGSKTVVEVEREDGKWARAIVESGNFSHEITANGLEGLAWFDSFDAMLAAPETGS